MDTKLTPEQNLEIYNYIMLEWNDDGVTLMEWLDAHTEEQNLYLLDGTKINSLDEAWQKDTPCPECEQSLKEHGVSVHDCLNCGGEE